MASAPPAPPCPLLLGGVLGSLGDRGEVGISHTPSPSPRSLEYWRVPPFVRSIKYVCSRELSLSEL